MVELSESGLFGLKDFQGSFFRLKKTEIIKAAKNLLYLRILLTIKLIVEILKS